MTHCKLPDILLCIWIQALVGGAIWWIKTWLELSGGLLTRLSMRGCCSQAFDLSSGGLLPCLKPVYSNMFDRWSPVLACSVSETAPLNLCHVCSNISDRRCCHVLTYFGLSSENASGGTLPCSSLCSGGTVPGAILTCFGMFAACLCAM